MGVRCLFGHEFGGREVERDRREDGEEVVVAYRTVETCERCGRRRVVSENKEVKPLRTESESTTAPSASEPDPTAPETLTSEAQTAESGSTTAPSPAADAGGDGGVEVMTASSDESPADGTPPSETPAPDASPAPESTDAAQTGTSDASDDAAIILDDAPESTDGTETEPPASDAGADVNATGTDGVDASADADDAGAADGWPAAAADDAPAASEATGTTGAWPAADSDDEGFDAETPTSGGPTATAGADPEPWPDEGRVEQDRNGTRFVRPDSSDGDVDGEAELHCPNCATAHAAASSSLRPGDVCPDCRKGYLAERAAGRNA